MQQQVFGLTDLHTHILPGVDDGAEDLARSMSLLELAWKDGTRRIVLTPHYRGSFRPDPQLLTDKFRVLQEEAARRLPELELYLGCEISFFHEAEELLKQGRLLTLNGTRHVLVEFTPGVQRTQLVYGLRSLLDAGYRPVLAHAERYGIMTLSLATELVDQGAFLQLNADSVLGQVGFRTRLLCARLLKERLVFCIASDAHDPVHRPPLLQRCYGFIRKKYGPDCAEALFDRNPRYILGI